jgi:CheY-like chemotaxis protein
MAIVFLTRDLMFSSRVAAAAAQHGVELETVADADATLSQCAQGDVALVIADLSTSGLEIGALMQALDQLSQPRPRVVAFAPHVHEAKLEAAAQAGCDDVLSRGQFNTRAELIIAAYRQ